MLGIALRDFNAATFCSEFLKDPCIKRGPFLCETKGRFLGKHRNIVLSFVSFRKSAPADRAVRGSTTGIRAEGSHELPYAVTSVQTPSR